MESLDVDRRVWPKILPYLSLCDLDCISQTSSTLQELVGQYTTQQGVHIEECCLRTLPIEIYKKYGQSVFILTLNSLPASDAHNVIGHFNRLSSLTLINMIILKVTEIMNFPLKLTELFLIDCKIERELYEWWTTQLQCTLRKLHLGNFYNILSLSELPQEDEVYWAPPNLESLTIEGNALRFYVHSSQLKYLKIRGNVLADGRICQGSPKQLDLHIHFDVPAGQWRKLKFFGNRNLLQRLTTRNLLPLEELRCFKCLTQLEILQPVDVQYKEDIEALNINTVKVVYNPASHPPEETNLIFKKLNEDCLLKIISHLKVPEWMSFGQVHPTIERILTDHKYPREVIKQIDVDDSGISEDLSHFKHVAQFIAHYRCDGRLKYIHNLTALNSLTLDTVYIDILPDRLEKLALMNCKFDFVDLTQYFQRLSSTLRALDVTGYNNYTFRNRWLKSLRNMREFSIDLYNISDIADMCFFVDRNAISLQRFEIRVGYLPEICGWRAVEDMLDRINSLKNLKHCRIQQLDDRPAMNLHLVTEVLKNVGPQLKTLAVDFKGTEMKEVLENERLRDLQELEINFKDDYREMAVTAIASMKNLRTLRNQIIPHNPSTLLLPTDIMFLVESMPKLTAISTRIFRANLSFELELEEYLRETKRTIKFNNVTFPCAARHM